MLSVRPRLHSSVLAVFVAVLVSTNAHAQDEPSASSKFATKLGLNRGLVAILGAEAPSDDGASVSGLTLALDLARKTELQLYLRDPSDAAVAAVRETAARRGLGLDRLTAETGGFQRMPFADNLIDAVLVPNVTKARLNELSLSELLRAVRPRGQVILRAASSNGAGLVELKTWASPAAVDDVDTWVDETGAQWLRLQNRPLEGVDEWTHWEHGPDNNPVSSDRVIQAPYMTQFLAGPLYIGMPSVTTAAGGRTFLAIGHIAHHRREWATLQRLIARNGYNGIVLWERELPERYLVHRSAFVASEDTFYMIDGESCLMLDAASGRERGRIRIDDLPGTWKWMAISDGILFALAGEPGPGTQVTRGDRPFGGWSWADLSKGYYGKRIPFGFGDTLAAYSLKDRKALWVHKEETLIDSRGMTVGKGRVYLYCPDRHLRSLDASSGEEKWTNDDRDLLGLIEKPGKGLSSTPGFRTACLSVLTPDALIIQGQTRMHVIGVSTKTGYLLWKKNKITNNPNAIFVDDKVILGVGPGGSHVQIDPATGNVEEDLKFRKVACTRLTASPDSFFCRGEGTMRFDRKTKRMLVDGAIRPACNDGAIPANGMLYLGPWQCDCNLTLIGHMGRCSAGGFDFSKIDPEDRRLKVFDAASKPSADFDVDAKDWPTYRGDNDRSSSSEVRLVSKVARHWLHRPPQPYVPTAPTAVGDLVFVAGSHGRVRALNAIDGRVAWEFATAGPIKAAVTIWEGRAFVASGDGHVYCLQAASGRLLWSFRAAPVERHIYLYGNVSSTWPVHSGVLIHEGVAYFAAGIVDHDGTHVYAVDAKTGATKWHNGSSGHLNETLRKGVSAQGNLTVHGNRLLLAGGNQVSPAGFDLETGKCFAPVPKHGRPKANAGRFVGMLNDDTVLVGGRILHSAPENVSTKGSFLARSKGKAFRFNFGGIPPAWNDHSVALVNFKHGSVMCCDTEKVRARIDRGYRQPRDGQRQWMVNLADSFKRDGSRRWISNLGETNKFEAVSLAVCPNAIVAVVRYQQRFRSQTQWYVVALDSDEGRVLFRHELPASPLPGGLLVDRRGHVVVTHIDGSVACFGPEEG